MSFYQIWYGTEENQIQITEKVYNLCLCKNSKDYLVVEIPKGDLERARLFSDPVPGTIKKIFIYRNDGLIAIVDRFTKYEIPVFTRIPMSIAECHSKLAEIHRSLKIEYGTFYEELPEQCMICRFLPTNAKVLEFGTNIGRSSLVISSILENVSNFVTMEVDQPIYEVACKNRDMNNKHYNIVNAALSSTDEPYNTEGGVPNITFEELKEKYPIAFDTLVIDCEGAFYNIVKNIPNILDGIKLIIIENDFLEINEKVFINTKLMDNNFHCVYRQAYFGSIPFPCADCFYETWQRFD